jgi:hypothetical protein
LRKSCQALVRTVLPGSATGAARVRLRRRRGVVSAILVMLVPLGGAMIIWNEMAVLPQDGQRLAHEGHSRSQAPQIRA